MIFSTVVIFVFQILSRGRIINAEKRVGPYEGFQTLNVPITQEMVPSARIVVYGVQNNVIIGDSLWLDIENKCKKEVSIYSL